MKRFDSEKDANKAIELSIGRILNIGSRPFKESDIEDYQRCKFLIIDACEFLGIDTSIESRQIPNGRNFGLNGSFD